jgi:hypothetical protein
LVARPRAEVASLQGKEWLDELDAICGDSVFSSGFGELLSQGPYQRDVHLEDADMQALLDVVERFIKSAARQPAAQVRR